MGRLDRNNGDIAATVYLSPALGGQLGVYCILDAGVPQRILGLDFLPRIGFVLREIGLVIKVSFDVLGKRGSQHGQEKRSAECCASCKLHMDISFAV